jgi:hypothetical protein
MEFNLFIIPMTLIIVELAKGLEINKKYLPIVSVALGAILGGLFSIYYHADLFTHVVEGIIYAATASGIYDVAKSLKGVK